MAPTFGVTHTNFSYRFGGQTFADWETQITLWISQAAAELAILLRQIGRDADDVTSGDDLYVLCARYIEHCVICDIARAQTRQDPELARAAIAERDRIEQRIRSHNESLTDADDFDARTMLGGFRAGGRERRTGWGVGKGARRW